MTDRTDITLSGTTSAWFERKREKYAEEHRNGQMPTRAEFVRLLLEDFDRVT
ncbi:hypothetical protein [Halosegnis longus]|uniref:hypothetical protein n=1 Tax=Halosegnis longus TaxID=2216012 RepID=UPI00129D2D35|nr:hypothetical protein [Halosegnis longus]